MFRYLNTGLENCYDEKGRPVDCRGSGQDAEYRLGELGPGMRFETQKELVLDRLTGLVWSLEANPAEFPLSWPEALQLVREWNQEGRLGRADWRLPNRRELRSLISYQNRKPALPLDHPFENAVLGWYWTSTTASINKAYAWYVHLEGGRMFYGKKSQYYLVWPVCGRSDILPATGQDRCFDGDGIEIDCRETGQDGELQAGVPWPRPRFAVEGPEVLDRLTGLRWTRRASLSAEDLDWNQALAIVRSFRLENWGLWRLPTINELETLVDARTHRPALPEDHPFTDVGEIYISSTSSGFEPDWSMLLHLHKGAVGVGRKDQSNYRVWPVRGPD